MKPSINPAIPLHARPFAGSSAALGSLCLFAVAALVACGSDASADFSEGSEGGNHGAVQAGSSNASAGRATGGNGPSGGGAGSAQSGAGNAAGAGGVCSSGDACAACLCTQCPSQVEACQGTPGCQAIAECVANSRCEGAACYCGTADTLACAAGTANGPCRDVILNAPGGHKPTLTDQSAGPAADAATAVANCGASTSAGCTALCQ